MYGSGREVVYINYARYFLIPTIFQGMGQPLCNKKCLLHLPDRWDTNLIAFPCSCRAGRSPSSLQQCTTNSKGFIIHSDFSISSWWKGYYFPFATHCQKLITSYRRSTKGIKNWPRWSLKQCIQWTVLSVTLNGYLLFSKKWPQNHHETPKVPSPHN